MLRLKFFLFINLYILLSVEAQGSSELNAVKQVEQHLITLADSLFRGSVDFMKLYKRENILCNEMQNVLRVPSSFNYDFEGLVDLCDESLEPYFGFLQSNDRLVRTFDWRSRLSDSMQHYVTLLQVKDLEGNVIAAKRKSSSGISRYESISRLSGTGRQLYLCLGKGQSKHGFVFQTVEIIEVKYDMVVDVTKELLPNRTYRLFYIHLPAGEEMSELPIVRFDSPSQTLYWPEIKGRGKTEGVYKYLQLQFKEKRFEVVNP